MTALIKMLRQCGSPKNFNLSTLKLCFDTALSPQRQAGKLRQGIEMCTLLILWQMLLDVDKIQLNAIQTT